MTSLKSYLKAIRALGIYVSLKPEGCFIYEKGQENYRQYIESVMNSGNKVCLRIKLYGGTSFAYPRKKEDYSFYWPCENWIVEPNLLHATIIYFLNWERQ